MEGNTEAGNMCICYHYFAKFPHPWKFCHFLFIELQSRTDHLKLGMYLRNMHRMGLDLCMVRQCGSAATLQTHLSPVHYRNLLSNVNNQCVCHWCLSLTPYTFEQVLTHTHIFHVPSLSTALSCSNFYNICPRLYK
jgi:hypothetical protein